MINLGTANGWKENPAEYTKHLAECGTEHEVTMCYMEYPAEGSAIKRQRQEVRRQYDVTVTRKVIVTTTTLVTSVVLATM